ncbi:hypothetical protein Hanom_Chr09g00805531 [Helianthus anomalus]
MAPSTPAFAQSPFYDIIDINDEDLNSNDSKPIEDKCPNKKMAPSTPGFAQSSFHDIIDIIDEDVNSNDFKPIEDGCAKKKMAPSTPGFAQSPYQDTIDISDEDVNSNEIPKDKKVSGSIKCGNLTKSQYSSKNNLQKSNLEHTVEEHMDEFRVHSSNTRSSKRKRAAKIITSDDEAGYDDNAPIRTLKTQHSSRVSSDLEEEVKENVSRKHQTRLRKSESKNKQHESSIDLNQTDSSSEDEEDNDGVDESESEGESLGGFIVDGSESVSNSDSESIDSADESEDVLNEYKETLDIIRRKKVPNLKWDLEGDMLSDFGKDPTFCMRAVCALYRRQTADEKESKKTRHLNERGFSKTDAARGSKMAEFLTDGDPDGDLVKTVEELLEYDPNGLKLCRTLATKYSRQLFEIYQNGEDSYFSPQ